MLTRRELGVGAFGVLVSRAAVAAAPPPRIELWSWVTPQAIADLDRNGMLFTPRPKPMVGRGQAFEVLDALTGPVAEALRGERFARGRFAWRNPWATCLGYGTHLVRLELLPTATFARFDAKATEAAGEVTPALAGFNFEDLEGPEALREIYVAEVWRWTRKTSAIASRLENDISFLSRTLRDAADWPPPAAWAEYVKAVWRGEKSNSYVEQLAYTSTAYRPSRENLQKMISTLQTRLKSVRGVG